MTPPAPSLRSELAPPARRPFRVKVCGVREDAAIRRAAELGASFLGFVLYPPSPRFVRPERLGELLEAVPPGVRTVGVTVDPTDAFLEHVLAHAPLDILQLHGNETPERVRAIALATGCRVMKAIRVGEARDLEGIEAFFEVADMLLFDARPPRDAAWPGGHGLPFDWRLLEGLALPLPWALAGGLDAGNLAAAVALLAPPIVDVSSRIERAPGIKDLDKLEAFMAEARRLGALGPEEAQAC
ncbi:MAG: phosphoribosylanthranilate isomerase [Geminicoccaceae bacterium]|nr:phosphoribosylanthranilate isomerase [Geminicoccaceae bacterium]MCX8100738.1 phosphoribosylanthranilate isomerase [Geminicoccaceae bacterium]MDW8369422.1 phosphoribosylanthranilate isomerase [Geminicoccaceae bacterium]